ncbi:MAG: hypothetical protein ABJE10_14455, partial [bacterium]
VRRPPLISHRHQIVLGRNDSAWPLISEIRYRKSDISGHSWITAPNRENHQGKSEADGRVRNNAETAKLGHPLMSHGRRPPLISHRRLRWLGRAGLSVAADFRSLISDL